MANLRGGIHNCVSISISQEAGERSKDILLWQTFALLE